MLLSRFSNCVLFVILFFPGKHEAYINLTTFGDNANGEEVECNTNVTLTCISDANTDTMVWRQNGSQIGGCTFGSCSSVPSLNNRYVFSFDIPNGIFNLTLQPVTQNESNAVFLCTSFVETTTITLKVIGDFSIHSSTEKTAPQTTHLKISTGCIPDNTIVIFLWKFVRPANQISGSLLPALPSSVEFSNSTACVTDTTCGGTGKTKQISTLTITEEDCNAESLYVAINVIYIGQQGTSRELQFKEGPFKIKRQPCYEDDIPVSKCSIIILQHALCLLSWWLVLYNW